MSSNILALTHMPPCHVPDQFRVLAVFIFKAAQNVLTGMSQGLCHYVTYIKRWLLCSTLLELKVKPLAIF